MKTARLNRLFGKSGNCFDVAIDHGMFNEKSFLSGIESMADAVDIVSKLIYYKKEPEKIVLH
jgi:DhnA family fructose-bisphosphate aldolase class Ia